MERLSSGTNSVAHIAFVVRDIEKTVRDFAEFLGLEMPKIKLIPPSEHARANLRGKVTTSRAKQAFLPIAPSLRLEFIEPDDQPSTWKEELERNEGFHHIALFVEGLSDIEGRLAGAGMPVIQSGEYNGGRYSYVDARSQLKTIVELLENDE